MSIPTAVFLDTSILDGQQYNYSSASLSTFCDAVTAKGVKLLLPDPTEREIQRHIRERSQEALKALDEARKRAPFLAKWSAFPKDDKFADWEVGRIATDEWRAFLARFSIKRLGYDGVDVARVMDKYDKGHAPFREGKKRKEFPDAFAVAILEKYAERTGEYIAVVSADLDFRAACVGRSSLLYFQTLPRLTETLLLDDESIRAIHAAITAGKEMLARHIAEDAGRLRFEPASKWQISQSNVLSAVVGDTRVVAIGADECTLAFEAEIEAEHDFYWEEYDSEREESHSFDESIIDTSAVNGTAKVSLTDDRTGLKAVSHVQFDSERVHVDERPPERFW